MHNEHIRVLGPTPDCRPKGGCCTPPPKETCAGPYYGKNVHYSGCNLFPTQIKNGDDMDTVVAKLDSKYDALYRQNEQLIECIKNLSNELQQIKSARG